MSKYSSILYALRKKLRDVKGECDSHCKDGTWLEGYEAAFSDIENVIFEAESNQKKSKMWYTGSPEELKAHNTDDYVVIAKALMNDSSLGVNENHVYIFADYWDGNEWNCSEMFEVLYWTKLKWLRFPLPSDIQFEGIKREDMFIK